MNAILLVRDWHVGGDSANGIGCHPRYFCYIDFRLELLSLCILASACVRDMEVLPGSYAAP